MNMYQSIHHAAGHGLAFARPFASGPHRRPKYNVPLNVTETDTEFEVFVYATGFGKEDITVTVVDDVLTIAGQKGIDEAQVPDFRRQEFPIKTFERTLALRGQVDTATIKARHENNVLTITLPKSPAAQVREQKIPVM